ncbi:TBC1 domain family member 25-like, partial [Notothenia coriiceps]|uniref:TBC1 domain family member 25-like n=1 Tax=Notothenia coriiceps TaxID=8208 RepID=A0A6I9PH92_9TELE
ISYCQGMSDIASPILAVMDNEAHAFICFCGIMKRLEGNFRPDGKLMSVKFQHLKLLLQYSDPEFYSYLVSRGADDLFFCYRWLLLELKREFAFEDALRMLEVTWSSLPPDPPETEVELIGPPVETNVNVEMSCRDKEKRVQICLGDDGERKEKQCRRHMLRPSREEDVSRDAVIAEQGSQKGKESKDNECDISPVTKEKADSQAPALERQTSFGEFKYYTARNEDSFHMEDGEQGLGSSDSVTSNPRRQSTVESEDDPGEKTPLIKNCSSPESSPPLFPSGLQMWKTGPSAPLTSPVSPSSWPGASPDSPPNSTTNGSKSLTRTLTKVLTSSAQVLSSTEVMSPSTPTLKNASPSHAHNRFLLSSPTLFFGRGSSPNRSSSNNLPSPGNKSPSNTANMSTSSKSETTSIKPCSLPPPQEFGKGNPFMLFLSLSILLEHRDHIIKNNFDYNELAMHFDRLVRRHNLSRVLQRAKALFADYLQSEVWDSEEGDEVSLDSPTTAPQGLSPTFSSRPIYSHLASPQSPNSTYNLATTIPSQQLKCPPPPLS